MNKKIYGKVKEIFLPNDEELTKVGFKIEKDNEIITIIKEQTKELSKIYREDTVIIEKIINNNDISYNIELVNNKVDGDKNE